MPILTDIVKSPTLIHYNGKKRFLEESRRILGLWGKPCNVQYFNLILYVLHIKYIAGLLCFGSCCRHFPQFTYFYFLQEKTLLEAKLADKETERRSLLMDIVTQSDVTVKRFTGLPSLIVLLVWTIFFAAVCGRKNEVLEWCKDSQTQSL